MSTANRLTCWALVAAGVVSVCYSVWTTTPVGRQIDADVVAVEYVDDIGDTLREITTTEGQTLLVRRSAVDEVGGPKRIIGRRVQTRPFSMNGVIGGQRVQLASLTEEPLWSVVVAVAALGIAAARISGVNPWRRAKRPAETCLTDRV